MELENDEILVKISDVCRACLSRTENMKCLLENNDETFLLLSKFAFVVNLEIQLGLNYPSYLCAVCEEKVLNSYEFQRQCQKSNELVSEYFAVFEKPDTVSTEPEPEIISRHHNTLGEVDVVRSFQDTTEIQEPEYEEISNSSVTSPRHKTELNDNKKCQEDLSKYISELKEKFETDCVCVFCEFQAASSTTLSDHVSRMHKEFENSWCSRCNKIFSNVEVHLEELHKHDFVCKYCQLQFSTLKLIIEHLQSHHVIDESLPDMPELALQENDNTCQVFSEKVDNQKLLETHPERHLVRCEFCSETLSINEENHTCSRARRKKNKVLELLQMESDQLSRKGPKCDLDLERQEKTIDTNAPIDLFKNFCPEEIPHAHEALQKMRLKQYSVQDVEKAINIVREKFYKQITCIFCKFSANTNRSLSVHVTRVHREYKEKWCSSCNKVIENQTRHYKEFHYEDLKCPFCKKIKSNMGHFMEHLASHCAERLHKCDICHKSFISKRHLRIHRETHLKVRPYTCKLCKKAFLQAKHLKAHFKTHSSVDKGKKRFNDDAVEDTGENESDENIENYTLNCKIESAEETAEEMPSKPHNYCKDCNRKVRSLPSHYKKYHITRDSVNSERKPNLCPHCGKRFATRSKLTEHMRIHTGETPYKCQYCDKSVKTRNILVVHERTHTGEKPYMCTVCGKTFAQSSILNTHLRIHTGRPEQCTICEKRFCRPAELRLHMRKHTGEKPYTCDHCGQGFKQKSHLVEHTRTHTEDRPYKCEHCKKAFKSSGILKSHLKIHTGQKPFKCSQCPYACRQPYSLTQHMVHHENDKPQLDYPHTCRLCQKNYATSAHLKAHHTRFHLDHELKMENVHQPPIDNEEVITDIHTDHVAELNEQNNYQTDSSFSNVDTVIIQTQSDAFEPIQIRFATMQDL